MKANELMIGDWMLYHEMPYQILGIKEDDENIYRCLITGPEGFNWWIKIADFQPIPLTPEILEKNGFDRYGDNFIYEEKDRLYMQIKLGAFIRVFCEMDNAASSNHDFHVHTLQHVLRLCGIEKEIVL